MDNYFLDRELTPKDPTGAYDFEALGAINLPLFNQHLLQLIGIPHDKWGEQVHAIVVLKEGQQATEEDILEHARQAIAGYKVPKSVEFRDEPIPLSGAMKPLKRELRKPYWEGKERAVN